MLEPELDNCIEGVRSWSIFPLNSLQPTTTCTGYRKENIDPLIRRPLTDSQQMPVLCDTCSVQRAILKRPKTAQASCRDCFFKSFEDEIHHTIVSNSLFQRGDRVAIGASGGKDSTVLAYLMKTLNERHDYGLDLFLLSIDEGITGYRDDSLETVKRNQEQYGLPLKVVSYKELYGWTMDDIVKKIGLKSNCTFCGVFRRQALDRGAIMLGVDKIVTGHNADDIAETVLMNILRGDIARLRRCTAITTGSEGTIPRSKPFKYTYEKEIVMYAYFKKLDYFSTECIYSPNAYRGHARAYLKDLECVRSSVIIDILHSGDSLCVKEDVRMPVQGNCKRCGYISSQELCKACLLLEGLNRGLPKLGIGKATGRTITEYVRKLQLKEATDKEAVKKKESPIPIEDSEEVVEGCVDCGCKKVSVFVPHGCGESSGETASRCATAVVTCDCRGTAGSRCFIGGCETLGVADEERQVACAGTLACAGGIDCGSKSVASVRTSKSDVLDF